MAKKNDPVAESRRQVEEQNAEAMARMDVQPTPTQEENDRAKLGVDSLAELDKKEGDGSPNPSEG